MFIIKFNNMVKNKWLWTAFAILVCIAFGASDIILPSRDNGEKNGIGLLNGAPVDAELFATVERYERFLARLSADEGHGEYTMRQVWTTYAAVVKARELGIVIPDSVLAESIQNDPSFAGADKTFDSRVYQMRLRDMDLTPIWYQEILRIYRTLAELRRLVSDGAYVPPSLVDERAHRGTDSYTVLPATLVDTNDVKAVALKPEEIESFYKNHTNLYALPERRSVELVTFKATDYLGEVGTVDPDEVTDFYESNQHLFTVRGTNGVETVKPLEECLSEVETAYAKQQSRELAYQAAATFADRFIDPVQGSNAGQNFANDAVAAGYAVTTTALFSATVPPVQYTVAGAFSDAVFSIDPEAVDLVDRIADPIGSEDSDESYVAVLSEVSPAHVPPFEDVKEAVERDALQSKVESAFQADIAHVRDVLTAAVTAGKSFAEAAQEAGLKLGTNVVLSTMDAYGKNPPIESARAVVAEMKRLGQGEFSANPVPVKDGAMFFAVLDRKPGDSATFSIVEMQAKRELQYSLSETIWNTWLKKNLETSNPEPSEPWDDEVGSFVDDED